MPRRPRPSDSEETAWGGLLLVGAVALVAVALVIGGVFSVLALSVAKVSGIGQTTARASAKPSLLLPSPSESPSASAANPSPSASPSASATPTKKPAALTLTATPTSVPAGGKIVLAGTAKVAAGVRLQVQRFEGGGWVDFPVTVAVTGGTYNTYITTSHTGPNRLRVIVAGSAKTSNVVRVTVG